MASANVIQFTDANFQDEVLGASGPVVVDFWAEYCIPCRAVGQAVEELAQEYQGRIKVGKMDTDANRQTPVTYGIHAIPTVIIFKDGQPQKRFLGPQSKDKFAEPFDELLN